MPEQRTSVQILIDVQLTDRELTAIAAWVDEREAPPLRPVRLATSDDVEQFASAQMRVKLAELLA